MKKNNQNNLFLVFLGIFVATCFVLHSVQQQQVQAKQAAANKESKPCK